MHDSDHYAIISADCHAGANLLEYRDYLAAAYHADFDAWAASYTIPYSDLTGPDGDRNWNSDRRLADMDDDGIVAEVIFPNTIPPFFPKASLTYAPPGANVGDAERRWAGLQAHNRWLVDFCARTPGRRKGIAQIMLHDMDAAVAEVRWAHAHGLTGGILLPGSPPGSGLPPLWDGDYYEPLWAVCEELGMPVNHHAGGQSPGFGDKPEDAVVFLLEVTWWAHRGLAHFIVSGAFERHPGLHVVFTEQGTAWIPDELSRLDYFFDRMKGASGSQEQVWGLPVVERLTLTPSEYFARQCHVGASFQRPFEAQMRDKIGIERIMWGSDYPHKEASFPYSRAALRGAYAGIPSDEVAAILGGNAARLYGFDLAALRPIADRIGPTVAEIGHPLRPGDVPKLAEKCPALVGFGAAN